MNLIEAAETVRIAVDEYEKQRRRSQELIEEAKRIAAQPFPEDQKKAAEKAKRVLLDAPGEESYALVLVDHVVIVKRHPHDFEEITFYPRLNP